MDADQPRDDRTQSFLIPTPGKRVSHYDLVDQLGSGGMGDVYLATDTALDRQVALKFLALALCEDETCRARFTREAQAAAKLSHPHVITIYEVGEFEKRPFLAMEYVEGESLQERAARKNLRLEDILHLALQICDGLAAAHGQGITHRDIKPSNILLDTHGRAKIVDFGLATVAGTQPLTNAGSTLGTIAYMSPEQASGEEVDARSDLFSLGVVLYELIAGTHPFSCDNAAAALRAIVEAKPHPLARYCASVPDDVQRIVSKLLQKNREVRYQHADDLRVDLTSALHLLESRYGTGLPREQEHEPSIAVLAFANLSTDPEQEYFCEGIAEEIITALTRAKRLQVAARTSSFAFKNKNEDIRDIGRKLNVKTVLEGSVRKAGNRLRITAQLINVADGYHLWSERYDRELEDVFLVQEEIAGNIVRALRIILSEDEKRALVRTQTSDIQAYDFYLRGLQFFHQRQRKSLRYARQMFARAIEIDPGYALAHAGVANCCSLLVHWYGESSDANLAQADEASRRALELDPHLAEAHASRGFALWLMKQHLAADREFDTALRLAPNYFEARYFYARACFQRGEMDKAVQLFEEACRVQEDHEARYFAAQTYIALGRQAEAEIAYRKAAQAVKKHLELNPDDSRAATIAAVSLCRLGDQVLGLKWAERALAIDPEDAGVRYNVACLYALEGQKARAIDCLEEAVGAGFANMEWVEKDPDLDSLRDDPRFQALMKKP